MIKENIVFIQSKPTCFTVNVGYVSPVEFIVIEVKLCNYCVRCTHFPPHLIYVTALPRKK